MKQKESLINIEKISEKTDELISSIINEEDILDEECTFTDWDFKISDEIEYFDPRKSYEITGYRPIDNINGLDFLPSWFTQDSRNKLIRGKYSPHGQTSKAHRDWWLERRRRCKDGMTVNNYRITGDNYFWLNYYRLKSGNTTRPGAGRSVSFPTFFVYQYEYFHYIEMCEILGKDVGLLKARGIGFSEMAASLCVRPFITNDQYRVVATAYSEGHLVPLLKKCWSQLDWLQDETEGGMRHLRQAKNTEMHKRASKKSKDGREFGKMSEVEGIVADNPDKVRGDRIERLFFEEAGANPVLRKSYVQGGELIKVLGERVGTRFVWGTGGSEGKAIEGIRKMTYEPKAWNILPYYHNHTTHGDYTTTSLFIPAYVAVLSHMDHRGWCDPQLGKEFYEKQRLDMLNDPEGLLLFKAEQCFTPEEALSKQGDNIFDKILLSEKASQIQLHKQGKPIERGKLVKEGDKPYRWVKHPDGKIFILEHPRFDEDHQRFKNLYVGGIDSIDQGTGDSSTKDGSDFCIVIKRRVIGLEGSQYVAIYKDRPRDIREAYDNALAIIEYYGCKAVLEYTKISLKQYFEERKKMHLLFKRPKATLPSGASNSNIYGVPATKEVIEHYLELISNHIVDCWQSLEFIDMIEQLMNYNYADKRKFDIVASMGIETCPIL